MQTVVQVVHILFIAIVSWWLWKQETTKMRKFFWPALAAKLSAGILLGVIYATFYTVADTFDFFTDAIKLSANARADFWGYIEFLFQKPPVEYAGENRTLFFVKIASIFSLITFDNYWICSLYFSWFSFLAAWQLTKFIWVKIPNAGIAAATAFLFFPTCVFWASGLMKEALTMVGIFYLLILFLRIWMNEKISWIHFPFVVLTIWVTWNLKYYYIGLLIPVMITTLATRWLVNYFKQDSFFKESAIWISLFCCSLLTASVLHPNFSLQRIVSVIAETHDAVILLSNTDDVIHFSNFNDSWSGIFANIPLALVSGFFRPFLWEANTFFKTAVSIENLVILLLSIAAIRSLAKIKDSPFRLLVLAILGYCIVLCVFLALSTPNFGTLVRLRIGFLPFLILILVNQPLVIRPLSRLFNVPVNDLKG
jgi:hypothetical protein